MSKKDKNNSPIWALVLILLVVLVAFVTIRYGAYNTSRTNEELYHHRLHWADRR